MQDVNVFFFLARQIFVWIGNDANEVEKSGSDKIGTADATYCRVLISRQIPYCHLKTAESVRDSHIFG